MTIQWDPSFPPLDPQSTVRVSNLVSGGQNVAGVMGDVTLATLDGTFISAIFWMSTAERLAQVLAVGQLVWDSDLGWLFLGNGAAHGGIVIGGRGPSYSY